uniref:Protein phosphatase 1 regulatory subunit 42 n=1 Tax=Anthurium amnicola TaxID=1678845 RepID=A0A1D1YY32_9ARAE
MEEIPLTSVRAIRRRLGELESGHSNVRRPMYGTKFVFDPATPEEHAHRIYELLRQRGVNRVNVDKFEDLRASSRLHRLKRLSQAVVWISENVHTKDTSKTAWLLKHLASSVRRTARTWGVQIEPVQYAAWYHESRRAAGPPVPKLSNAEKLRILTSAFTTFKREFLATDKVAMGMLLRVLCSFQRRTGADWPVPLSSLQAGCKFDSTQ